MTMGYYEVDDLVASALERGDFDGAREYVVSPDASISRTDKDSLLKAINDKERSVRGTADV